MNNLVPIQITLQAANAADVKQLVYDLAGTMTGMPQSDIPAETSVSTVQPETSTRTRKTTKKEEPEGKKIDVDAITKEIEEEAEEFLNSSQDSAEIPTVVDLRAKAQEVGQSAAGKKAVKDLLNKFECPNISNVPEEKRIEFMAALEELV